ncbi:MAG: DUF7594 domain-containing protein [Ardenticatenaceae bacterium]
MNREMKGSVSDEVPEYMARVVGRWGAVLRVSFDPSTSSGHRKLRNRSRRRWWLFVQGLLGALFLLFGILVVPFEATTLADTMVMGGACNSSGPGITYTVTICLSGPVDGALLTGTEAVTATITVDGTDPRVRRVTYYLDGQYILRDHTDPYIFELPTDYFVDGLHSLSAEVLMRDGYISDQISMTLTFSNSVTTSPPTHTNTFTPYTGTLPPAGEPFVVAATGDGAGAGDDVDAVSDLVIAQDPDMFVYLGDVYEKGTYTEFYNWYGTAERKYGRFRDITNPTIGNHEYEDGEAPGYFFYWNDVPDYYSYDAGGWHFIVLNSNSQLDETEPGTPQYEWLVQDLMSNSALCTIAYFHHPVLSVGPQDDTPRMNDMWQVMADYGVDIVLTGHDHSYQRWQPLDRDLNPNPQGITQFVHGAGGHGVQDFVREDERFVIGYGTHDPEALGVLRLELNATAADFRYENIDNEELDSGQIPCRETLPDTTPPTPPSNLMAENQDNSLITLSWEASLDNTTVAGYTIYRNGVEVATISDTLSYTDTDVSADHLYLYSVEAFDPFDNRSQSDVLDILTIPSITLTPQADAYTRADEPDTNRGTEKRLRTDGSPHTVSYLRFDVPNYSGELLSATLRIHANEEARKGYVVSSVADNSWDELSISYNNRPPIGDIIGSVEPFPSAMWTEVDVTPLIMGDGQVTVAISTTSSSNVDYSSREGVNPPELLLRVFDRIHLPPVADSTVKSDDADSNFGSESQIQTAADPERSSFLRFDVPALNSENISATLRVYAESVGEGYQLHSVADNSWEEVSVTYNNSPTIGSIIGSVGPFVIDTQDTWTEIDVTSVITGEGLLSFALTSDSITSTNTLYASREGSHPPELLIESPNSCGGLIQEAENGILYGDFVTGTDSLASGGQYIHVPNQTHNEWNGPDPLHKVEYCFNVETEGTYRIKAAVYAETGADNSFYVEVDEAPTNGYLWDVLKNSDYEIDYVSNRNGADPVEVSLSPGTHHLAIFLREDGTRLDQVELELVKTGSEDPICEPGLVKEAEEGQLTGDFMVDNDGLASGGQYIHVPNGAGNSFSGPDPTNQAEYCFQVDSAGTYRIKAAVYAATGADNSFYVQVHDSPSSGYLWDFPKNSTYEIDHVSDRNGADPVEVVLSAGEHSVKIFLRENGARLDTLELELITSTTTVDPSNGNPPLAGDIFGTLFINHDQAEEELDLSGINLTLVDTESGGATYNETAQTDHLGKYNFDEMLIGQYKLTLSLPQQYSTSQPTEIDLTSHAEQMVEASFDIQINEQKWSEIYLPLIIR